MQLGTGRCGVSILRQRKARRAQKYTAAGRKSSRVRECVCPHVDGELFHTQRRWLLYIGSNALIRIKKSLLCKSHLQLPEVYAERLIGIRGAGYYRAAILVLIKYEDIFYSCFKRTGDIVGQLERGIIFALFQKDNGLAAHAHTISELFLRQPLQGAVLFYPRFHACPLPLKLASTPLMKRKKLPSRLKAQTAGATSSPNMKKKASSRPNNA